MITIAFKDFQNNYDSPQSLTFQEIPSGSDIETIQTRMSSMALMGGGVSVLYQTVSPEDAPKQFQVDIHNNETRNHLSQMVRKSPDVLLITERDCFHAIIRKIDKLESNQPTIYLTPYEFLVNIYDPRILAQNYVPPPSGWVSIFDNTKWTPRIEPEDDPLTYGFWNGTAWETGFTNGQYKLIQLFAVNDWNVGFRPSQIKITYNWSTSKELALWGGNWDTVDFFDAGYGYGNYASDVPLNVTYDGTDLNYIQFGWGGTNGPEGPGYITNIEFLLG